MEIATLVEIHRGDDRGQTAPSPRGRRKRLENRQTSERLYESEGLAVRRSQGADASRRLEGVAERGEGGGTSPEFLPTLAGNQPRIYNLPRGITGVEDVGVIVCRVYPVGHKVS